MKSLFGWNNVSLKNVYGLLLINIIIYMFIFHIIDRLPISLKKCINDIQYTCFANCNKKSCKKLTNLRDKNYYLNDYTGINLKTCMATSWELLHLLFHIFIGYYYNIYLSLATSISFEIFEHYVYECGSYLDIFWNFIGFLIGFSLK